MILEMCKEVYITRSGLKHHIHLVIQPHMDTFCVALNGSVYYVMRALKERCAESLRVLKFRSKIEYDKLTNILYNHDINKLSINIVVLSRANRNLPPNHFEGFFKTFPNLTHIDLWGSIIDDIGINAIGEL